MFAALFLLAAMAAPAHQSLERYSQGCSGKASSQMEMNMCAEQELERADKALNAAWVKARASAKDDPRTTKLLLASQRAWLKYRDAECALVADLDRGGSIAPQSQRECAVDLTKERTKDLVEFVQAWKAH
ncbi:MAG: lysozyme inhibitor LprI family protein [Sphingomicrobium sp.]